MEMRKLVLRLVDEIEREFENLIEEESASEYVGIGASGDLSARIDLELEELALDILRSENVPAKVVTEERGVVRLSDEEEFTIYLDPLDGTTNALRRIPVYSTSIAISRSGRLELGVVRNLVSGDTYLAQRGMGARKNERSLRIGRPREKRVLATYINGNLDERLLDLLRMFDTVRSLGSAALEICLVSEGAIEAFVDLRGKLRITDIAAASLILEEAGGVITDDRGERIPLIDDLGAKFSIIASSRNLHSSILRTIGAGNDTQR